MKEGILKMIKTNTSKRIRDFMNNQQNKIESWNINVPEVFFENEEKQKINVMILILKTILINTRDVLYSINKLDKENNTTGVSILIKTLIENTIDLKYSIKFYKDSNLEQISSVIDKSEYSMFGKNVKDKSRMVFDKVKINGKDTTLIYENYRKMCKIAHPDFEQLYSILRNMSKNYSPKLLLEFNLNSPIFSKTEHKEIMKLRDELIQIIEQSINEIGILVTERYIDNELLNFNISNGFLTFSITEQGLKKLNRDDI